MIDRSPDEHSSHLFTLRLWEENLGGGEIEWRSKLRHVVSGETSYFRDWPVLIALLRSMLDDIKRHNAAGE